MATKRVFKRMSPPREPRHGGIYDVPGYPCVHCKHLDTCNDMKCAEFQRFWRVYMWRVRNNLGIAQPDLPDEYKLSAISEAQEDKP